MKLLYKFEMVELDGGITAVPIGDNAGDFCGVLNLNKSAAEMLELIGESDSLEEASNKLCAIYSDEDKEVIKKSLKEFADNLVKEGILIIGD